MKKFVLCLPLLLVPVLAGCGSARAELTFSAPTTVKLASAQTGAHIACQRGPGPSPGHTLPNGRLVVGTIPAPGKTHAWVNGLDGNGINLYLSRGANGSLLVKCS